MNDRPYIILHLSLTLDGKVTGKFLKKANWDECIKKGEEFNGDAYAIGKTTMSEFNGICKPDLSKYKNKNKQGKKDFIVKEGKKYLIVFDRKGSLGYDLNILYNDSFYNKAFEPKPKLLIVLTEQTPEEYLAYLQEIGVSYIICGKEDTDMKLALHKLKNDFGINKIILEGGSVINHAFQVGGFVDEVSLVYFPFIAEKEAKPLVSDSIFEEFEFIESKMFPDKTLWTHLKKKQ